MWVSKEKYEALEKRIQELESFKRDSTYYRYFYVYEPEYLKRIATYQKAGVYSTVPLCSSYAQSICVKDVVEKILEHIGLKLTYREGQSSGVEVVKAKKRSGV